MIYPKGNTMRQLLAIMIIVIMAFSMSGCTMTKQYQSKESGKKISEELTKVYQLGIAVRLTYDTLKLWKPDLCDTGILNDEQCSAYDMLLYKTNGVLTIYSKASTYWYELEVKPDSDIKLDKATAIAMIKRMLLDKDELVNGIKSIVGKKMQVPMIEDFTPFKEYVGE